MMKEENLKSDSIRALELAKVLDVLLPFDDYDKFSSNLELSNRLISEEPTEVLNLIRLNRINYLSTFSPTLSIMKSLETIKKEGFSFSNPTIRRILELRRKQCFVVFNDLESFDFFQNIIKKCQLNYSDFIKNINQLNLKNFFCSKFSENCWWLITDLRNSRLECNSSMFYYVFRYMYTKELKIIKKEDILEDLSNFSSSGLLQILQ